MSASVGFGPLERIDGPPPIAPLFGILPAAAAPTAGVRIIVDVNGVPLEEDVALAIDGFDLPHPGEERWMNGVEVYPYPPGLADIHDPCPGGSDASDKNFGDDVKHPQFGALTVYFAETCTSYKVWSQEQFKARAVAAFSAVESAGVAHEFLTGRRMPLNPHLADGEGEFPNGDDPTTVVNGLGLLEAQIARSGRQGLIHCSPQIATSLLGRGFAISDKTGVIRTINGIVVIPDFGYVDGATPAASDDYPDGHADPTGTQQWMYASGPIDLRRSEVFTTPDNVSEALDRGTGAATNGRPNSITYRVERFYLVDWDTEVQAAVLVDPCQLTCEAGS